MLVTEEPERPTKGRGLFVPRVKLQQVEVRFVQRHNPLIKQLVHPDDLKQAEKLILIEVRVDEPFDPMPRTSSPVIFLNGKPLGDTTIDQVTRDIVRVIVDYRQLKDKNIVEVAWLGNENQTKSLEPYVFMRHNISK